MDGNTTWMIVGASLFGGGAVYWTVDAVANHWRKVKVAEFAATLKQQMIEKGFSADEIAQVVGADADAAAPGGGLTTALIDGGFDADDVAEITTALDAAPAGVRPGLRAEVAKFVENGYDGDDIVKFIARRVESAAPVPA